MGNTTFRIVATAALGATIASPLLGLTRPFNLAAAGIMLPFLWRHRDQVFFRNALIVYAAALALNLLGGPAAIPSYLINVAIAGATASWAWFFKMTRLF